MKTNSKWISCILTLMVIGTSAVWAQAPNSPQNTATQGLTKTDVDQFMNVTGWSRVKFDKAFTFAGFEQGTNNRVDLGAAFKAGPVYIGSWYQGNIGSFTGKENKQRKTTVTDTNTDGIIDNTRTEDTPERTKSYKADHRAFMLVGFGNIGINFGYSRNGTNKSGTYYKGTAYEEKERKDTIIANSTAPQAVNSITYDPKGFVNRAYHAPYIGFGMNVALGKMTLSPTASLEIAIKQESVFGKKTVTLKSKPAIGTTTITQEGKSGSYTGITGRLGTGLVLGDSLNSVLTFGYRFTVDAYGTKNYTAADGSKKKLGKIYDITTDTFIITKTASQTEEEEKFDARVTDKKTYFSNTFTLGYSMKKDFTDRFTFLAGAHAHITFNIDKTVERTIDTKVVKTMYHNPASAYNNQTVTTETFSPVETRSTTTLRVTPTVKAAVSYAAIPNRLFLNAGTSVRLFEGSHTAESTTYDTFVKKTTIITEKADGSVTKQTSAVSSAQTEKFNKTGSLLPVSDLMLQGGLRWNIVENVGFDLVYTQSLLNNTIEWTKFGNLKLACSITF